MEFKNKKYRAILYHNGIVEEESDVLFDTKEDAMEAFGFLVNGAYIGVYQVEIYEP